MASTSRAGLLGIILGSVFGLGGLFSGIYFGIIAPLRESGRADQLPTPLIVGSAVLCLALVAYLIYVFTTRRNKRKHRPPEW
jgi:protein-S-isoprenylcysteine O-methyltransferase Ste14